jgi:dCMP deaminase
MNPKWIKMYMDFALRAAQESHAVRRKVGAVLVTQDGVMSMGINGLPAGGSNECEIVEWCNGGGWLDPETIEAGWPYEGTYKDSQGNELPGRYRLVTKEEVSHAEENLISKLMRAGVSTKGGELFLTMAPCINCAKIIVGAGIGQVYYLEEYRKTTGVEWLTANGISVHNLSSWYDPKQLKADGE